MKIVTAVLAILFSAPGLFAQSAIEERHDPAQGMTIYSVTQVPETKVSAQCMRRFCDGLAMKLKTAPAVAVGGGQREVGIILELAYTLNNDSRTAAQVLIVADNERLAYGTVVFNHFSKGFTLRDHYQGAIASSKESVSKIAAAKEVYVTVRLYDYNAVFKLTPEQQAPFKLMADKFDSLEKP